MIEKIELNCGHADGADPLVLDGALGVTIFVGPNNSGKSALLDALHKAISGGSAPRSSALQNLRATKFKRSQLDVRSEFKGKKPDETVTVSRRTLTKQEWIEKLERDTFWQGIFGQSFRSDLCIWLDGTSRLRMLRKESSPNLKDPETALATLLTDNARRRQFQDTVYDGIGHYPFVDHVSAHGNLCLAFSTEEPRVEVERSINDDMIRYAQNSINQESVSDGFNAYVGIIGTLFASDYQCILIDEPEAFLHPALARTLGKQLALQAREQHVFAASHSADFVMGAIESGIPVRIVRLQYLHGSATANLLDTEELKSFMNDPLLRSANVLSGLFAKSVVVGESDLDRAFYQEINTRLLSAKDPRGIENAIFLNAQNKQTVPRIVGLLRKMGVPTIGIVDLDVVSEGGTNWSNQLSSIGISQELRKALEVSRKSLFDALKEVSTDSKNKDYKRRGGIELLADGKKEIAENLLETLEKYGLLIVRRGEIEAWLRHLDISPTKQAWLHEVFDKLGSDPNSNEYVKPQDGDVWDFLGKACEWLDNPKRKGMMSLH